MTAVLINTVVAALISLVFEYLPGAKGWFDTLSTTQKRLFMLGMTLIVSLSIFGLNCFKLFTNVVPPVSCDQVGIEQLVIAWITAIGANQTTFFVAHMVESRVNGT